MLTLYRARLSRHWLCLIMLPEVETFALILLVVTAGAVDVVVDVAADAFTTPRFFSEPIEPFNKSGLSTSGPPNSWSCCNQQHNIASIPSSTCECVCVCTKHIRININNHIINSITFHVNIKIFQNRLNETDTHVLRCYQDVLLHSAYPHILRKKNFLSFVFSASFYAIEFSKSTTYSFIHFSVSQFTLSPFVELISSKEWEIRQRERGEKGSSKLDFDAFS